MEWTCTHSPWKVWQTSSSKSLLFNFSSSGPSNLSNFLAFQSTVLHLPGVAVHVDGLSRLVGDPIMITGTVRWLDAATFAIRNHPRWTHTAGNTPCAHLQCKSTYQHNPQSYGWLLSSINAAELIYKIILALAAKTQGIQTHVVATIFVVASKYCSLLGKKRLTQVISNVLQLFWHSVPFAAGPAAEQLKNSMGAAQVAVKVHYSN